MSPGRRRLSARTGVLALLAGLLTTSAILWVLVVSRLDAPMAEPTLSWWVLAPLFAAAEVAVLHVQIQREAQTISLSEVPLVLALFFAPPHDMLAAAVLGSGAVYVLFRRQSAVKALFNITLRVFGVIVVLCLAHAFAGSVLLPGPRAWVASMAAVSVAGAVDGLLVLAVVGMHDGTVHRTDALKELFRYPPISAVVGCVGLVAVTALHADPRTGPMLAVVAVALFAAYRAHASLNDQHVNLARLYDVGRSVTGAHDAQHILGGVLAAACDLLRAEAAEIVLLGTRPDEPAQRWVFTAGSTSPRLETVGPDHPSRWRDLPSDATAQLLARGAVGPAGVQLARLGYREGLVVALQDESGVLGTMLVADRMGEVRAFHAEDLPVLETVATQASLALSNARLLERLRHEALHDVLTGLANRAKFRQALDEQLIKVDDGSSPGCAVLLLDLNGFKEVNDSLGHHSGDAILLHVAQCLTRVAGAPATAARLGGDEFAVLLPDAATVEVGREIADRIHHELAGPLMIDGIEVQARASIGIALAPAHARDASGLLRAADAAMYSAKSTSGGTSDYAPGRNPQPEATPVATTRLALLAELRAAIAGDEVTIHLQPQARATTGEVFAAEALIRWNHPRLGVLRPADFLALAERHGLIHELTEIVLDKAVAAAASWSAAGFDLSVAVNLAVRSLLDPRIVATVEAVLDRHHLPASRLTLEITEDSVMTDPERAIAVLNALRALGVRLSVDDFGTGYSSLTYLQRLPVDEVKIDRSFVSSVDHDTNDLLITRSIIDLGANLSLEVIAEGVEDQATWDRLATLGCHGIQGDHLAPPLPADVMLIWLRGYTTRAGTNRLGTPPGATTGTDVSPPRPRSPRRTADAPRSVDARGAGPGRPRR